jgi:hypothetical protein
MDSIKSPSLKLETINEHDYKIDNVKNYIKIYNNNLNKIKNYIDNYKITENIFKNAININNNYIIKYEKTNTKTNKIIKKEIHNLSLFQSFILLIKEYSIKDFKGVRNLLFTIFNDTKDEKLKKRLQLRNILFLKNVSINIILFPPNDVVIEEDEIDILMIIILLEDKDFLIYFKIFFDYVSVLLKKNNNKEFLNTITEKFFINNNDVKEYIKDTICKDDFTSTKNMFLTFDNLGLYNESSRYLKLLKQKEELKNKIPYDTENVEFKTLLINDYILNVFVEDLFFKKEFLISIIEYNNNFFKKLTHAQWMVFLFSLNTIFERIIENNKEFELCYENIKYYYIGNQPVGDSESSPPLSRSNSKVLYKKIEKGVQTRSQTSSTQTEKKKYGGKHKNKTHNKTKNKRKQIKTKKHYNKTKE